MPSPSLGKDVLNVFKLTCTLAKHLTFIFISNSFSSIVVSRCPPLPPLQPTQQPTPPRPRAPLRGQRDEGSPLVRRRRAPRGPAVPWAPHDAKPRTPSRMTSSSGSVRHSSNQNSADKPKDLGTCFITAIEAKAIIKAITYIIFHKSDILKFRFRFRFTAGFFLNHLRPS